MAIALICPVCTSNQIKGLGSFYDVEIFSVPDKFSYFNCLACDSIFIDPMPVNRLSEIYPDTYYSNSAPDDRSIAIRVKDWLDRRLFKKILKDIPGQSLSVLDVGGGSGWMLNSVKACDARVKHTAVVDLNEKARGLAEKFGHQFHCQTIESFSSDVKFDLIIMLNLIEHVADPGAVLKAMGKLLTTNGKILLKTPNTKTLDRYIFEKSYWGGYHCPRHWVIFNEESLTELAKKNELSVVSLSYTQGAPQWAMSVYGAPIMKNGYDYKGPAIVPERPMQTLVLMFFAAFDFIRMPFMRTAQMFVLLKKQGSK